MSSTNPSDPQLLLPEWLRDGSELPASRPVPTPPAAVATVEPAIAPPPVASSDAVVAVAASATPYSDRLSLDTRLDPGQLVSAADLPKWLGGLQGVAPAGKTPAAVENAPFAAMAANAPVLVIEEPEPYIGADAPQDGVVDVEINGWLLIAAALGLLVLLAAALKLYLS